MGLFNFKKTTSKNAHQLKEISFPLASRFKGFKKIHLAVYGVAEYPENPLETSGQTLVLKQYVYNGGDIGWKVYLNNIHIGSVYNEGAEAFNNGLIDSVYIKYETEITNGNEHWRPQMFVHYKE